MSEQFIDRARHHMLLGRGDAVFALAAALACFDLDGDDHVAPAREYVDLAAAVAIALGQHAITFAAQVERGEFFSGKAEAIGFQALVGRRLHGTKNMFNCVHRPYDTAPTIVHVL